MSMSKEMSNRLNQMHAQQNRGEESQEEIHDKFYAEQKRLSDIERLKEDIEIAEERIKRADAFIELEKNEHYKTIFEKGYFDQFLKGAVRACGRGTEKQKEFHSVIDGVGHCQVYLEGVMQFGSQAKIELPRMKDELARLQQVNATFK